MVVDSSRLGLAIPVMKVTDDSNDRVGRIARSVAPCSLALSWVFVAVTICATDAAVYENSNHEMTAGDFHGDGRNEVAYVRGDGTIFVHDFTDGQSRRVPCALADKLIAADLDGNGRDELVFIDGYSKHVRSYDFVTKSFSTLADDTTYRDLSSGDADNDGVAELLLSQTDYVIRYFDGSVQDPLPDTFGHRMVRGDFMPIRLGDEFAMRGSDGRLYYFDPDIGELAVGGGTKHLAAGNIYVDEAHPGDEVLLNNSTNELWVHNYTADAWNYPGTLEEGASPGIGRLDADLPAEQELSYVIGTGAFTGQVEQSDPGDPLAYLLLRRDGSDTGSAAATGNAGWSDMLVADVNGDGLEELIARNSAAPDALHRFDNGTAGFNLATPSSNLLLINDSSFEDTKVVDDGANNVAPDPADSWTETGWDPNRDYHSIFDPADAQFAGTGGDDANAQGVLPYGGQVGMVKGDTTLWQNLGPVLPGGEYTLSFWVGDRRDSQDTNYQVELLAGSDTIIDETNPLTPVNGRFELVTLSGLAPLDASGDLVLRFTGLAGQTFFDELELLVTGGLVSSPEPSTAALLGIGVAGLLFGARRRRGR